MEDESYSEANLPTATSPLRVIYDARFAYLGYRRCPSSCWLRVYVSDIAGDLPVVVATELTDNEGTSVTNVAEKLAWHVVHDPAVWAQAPDAAREGMLWIEHYPHDGTSFGETFSLVTFAYTQEAEAEADTYGTMHVVKMDPETGDVASIRDFPVKPADDAPHGSLGEPDWSCVTRAQVEQLIGQPFPAIPVAGGSDATGA
jgi:hypothetical protein